jgi:hypothetical protein
VAIILALEEKRGAIVVGQGGRWKGVIMMDIGKA